MDPRLYSTAIEIQREQTLGKENLRASNKPKLSWYFQSQ